LHNGGKTVKLFKNLFHVTLFANDIRRSLDFYNKLGFETLFDVRMSPKDEPWNYYLRIAHEQYLEIQTVAGAAPSPHPAPSRVRKCPDQSLWHFALQTENIDLTIKKLIENSITVWKDPERTGIVKDMSDVFHAEDGCLIVWLIDPDGNPIEVMEQVGQTLQRETDYKD